jgi:N utilization substance protein A
MEGIVTIQAAAREAGGRSKIAVSSNETRVDPVGACVGMKGSRVQGIVRELSGERIDIVPFSEDPIAFVTKALSPAKILQTQPDDASKRMKVIVTEDQLSLAIGKNGQNARLAAKLTGWEIDLVSEEEFAASRGETRRSDAIPVERLDGIGPKTIENLVQAGFESVQDIVRASLEDLINVPGVGDVTAQKIYLTAVQTMEKVEEEKAIAAAEAAADAEEASAKAAAQAASDAAVVAAALAPRPLIEEAEAEPAEVEPAAAEPTASEAVEEPAAAETAPAPRPRPAAPAKAGAGGPDSYLDDIEAMESELTSGWEEDNPGSGDQEPAPKE